MNSRIFDIIFWTKFKINFEICQAPRQVIFDSHYYICVNIMSKVFDATVIMCFLPAPPESWHIMLICFGFPFRSRWSSTRGPCALPALARSVFCVVRLCLKVPRALFLNLDLKTWFVPHAERKRHQAEAAVGEVREERRRKFVGRSVGEIRKKTRNAMWELFVIQDRTSKFKCRNYRQVSEGVARTKIRRNFL